MSNCRQGRVVEWAARIIDAMDGSSLGQRNVRRVREKRVTRARWVWIAERAAEGEFGWLTGRHEGQWRHLFTQSGEEDRKEQSSSASKP